MKKIIYFLALIGVAVQLQSCGAMRPISFVQLTDGMKTWTSIFIRDNLNYDKAFDEVLNACAERFEMDIVSKEIGTHYFRRPVRCYPELVEWVRRWIIAKNHRLMLRQAQHDNPRA